MTNISKSPKGVGILPKNEIKNIKKKAKPFYILYKCNVDHDSG